MASVYGNAALTIAASRAADGSDGLFSDVSQKPYITKGGRRRLNHPGQWEPFKISDELQFAFWMAMEPTHDVPDHRRRGHHITLLS